MHGRGCPKKKNHEQININALYDYMKTKVIIVTVAAVILASTTYCLTLYIKRAVIRTHQEGIAVELRDWSKEYSVISTVEQAEKAVEMVEYIKQYYVVGPGYQSFDETDEYLEQQRKKAIHVILEGLQKYTGQDLGEDIFKWKEAVQRKKLDDTRTPKANENDCQ